MFEFLAWIAFGYLAISFSIAMGLVVWLKYVEWRWRREKAQHPLPPSLPIAAARPPIDDGRCKTVLDLQSEDEQVGAQSPGGTRRVHLGHGLTLRDRELAFTDH